jgi:hypothetical protein
MPCPKCSEIVKPLIIESGKGPLQELPGFFGSYLKVTCPDKDCEHEWRLTDRDLKAMR